MTTVMPANTTADPAVAFARAAAFVHQAAENRKESGQALDFIENDQLPRKPAEVELGIGEFGEIGRALKVEVVARFVGDQLTRQGCLSDLTRSEQDDDRRMRKTVEQ